MLNHLDPDKKKSKYKEILAKLIKQMDSADCEDNSMSVASDDDDEEKEEMAAEEHGAPMEAGSESAEELVEAEPEEHSALEGEKEQAEEMSDEERKEMLSSRNRVPKPKGTITISVASVKPMMKKSKGRPKGGKGKY